MVDASEARGCMLKLKEGFEIKDDGRGLNYVARKGADFAARIASWINNDVYFMWAGSVIEMRERHDNSVDPCEIAHRMIVRCGTRYGVESPWEAASDAPDLRTTLTRIIEARDAGTVNALIDEIESARRILRGESC